MDISSRPSYIEPSTSSSLASASSFAEKCQGLVQHLPVHRRLVEPVLTPRFVPTCSNELLKGLGRLSEEKSLRIQSHLAEAEDQVKWVRGERGMEDINVFSQVRVLVTGKKSRTTLMPNIGRSSHSAHRPSTLHLPRWSRLRPCAQSRNRHRALSPIKCLLLRASVQTPRGFAGPSPSRARNGHSGRV
jgi:hypothetical protein